jgi:hypothetical protein
MIAAGALPLSAQSADVFQWPSEQINQRLPLPRHIPEGDDTGTRLHRPLPDRISILSQLARPARQ